MKEGKTMEASAAPITSQQMHEMMNLLRKNSPDGQTGGNATAGKSFLQRLSSLSSLLRLHSTKPAPKWILARRNFIMISLTLLVTTFLIFSGVIGISNAFTIPSSQDIMASFSIVSGRDTTLYYNTKKGEEDQALPLDRKYDGKSVICVLVTNNEKDIAELQVALGSLVFLQGDTDLPSPVLVFNEDNLQDSQIEAIRASTNRPVAFPIVDMSSFPVGFDPNNSINQGNHFAVVGRKPWGYYHMIRFYLTQIWHHPSVERYEIVMRIDSDSCFKEPNSYLPGMMYDHIDYHSQYVGVEPEKGKPYLEGLFDYTAEYLERTQTSPGNIMLWHFIETTWKLSDTLPLFYTNLEISKKSYMLRPDVQKWHNTLTEEEPFGVFRYRWGDSDVRFIEAAVFGNDSNMLSSRHEGYYHKKHCSRAEVEEAMKNQGFA